MEEQKLLNRIAELEALVIKYEENGVAKLYYSLSRKSWEMADMLNSISMKNLVLDDPKDKTFERMRFIINDSAGIATAVKALGEAAGITGNEEEDTKKPTRIKITPESIAGSVSSQQE